MFECIGNFLLYLFQILWFVAGPLVIIMLGFILIAGRKIDLLSAFKPFVAVIVTGLLALAECVFNLIRVLVSDIIFKKDKKASDKSQRETAKRAEMPKS